MRERCHQRQFRYEVHFPEECSGGSYYECLGLKTPYTVQCSGFLLAACKTLECWMRSLLLALAPRSSAPAGSAAAPARPTVTLLPPRGPRQKKVRAAGRKAHSTAGFCGASARSLLALSAQARYVTLIDHALGSLLTDLCASYGLPRTTFYPFPPRRRETPTSSGWAHSLPERRRWDLGCFEGCTEHNLSVRAGSAASERGCGS